MSTIWSTPSWRYVPEEKNSDLSSDMPKVVGTADDILNAGSDEWSKDHSEMLDKEL